MPPFAFVTDAGIANLAKSKHVPAPYTSVDNLMEPLWLFLAGLVPRWVSPNLVSVVGGLCSTMSSCLALIAVASRSTSLCVWSGAFLLAYMNADAVDGKHARATGQTSPLGAIVDHGIDAFTAFHVGVALCYTVDPSLQASGIAPALCAFHSIWYVSQWAELEVGSLDSTGATEGEILCSLCLSLPGWLAASSGTAWVYEWPISLPRAAGFREPVPLHVFVAWGVFAWAAGALVLQFLAVARKVRIAHWWPLVHIAVHNVVSLLLSSTPLFGRSPLLHCLVIGMDACQLMTKMRLAASTHTHWPRVHLEMLPFLFLSLAQLAGIDVPAVAWACVLAWQMFALTMLWINTISRICEALHLPFLAPIPKRA